MCVCVHTCETLKSKGKRQTPKYKGKGKDGDDDNDDGANTYQNVFKFQNNKARAAARLLRDYLGTT